MMFNVRGLLRRGLRLLGAFLDFPEVPEGEKRSGYLGLRDLGMGLGILGVLGFAVWFSAVGIHDGWFPTSEQKTTDLYVPSEVMIEVEADGRSLIVGAHHVSDQVKALIGTAYQNPEEAEEAASGLIEAAHEQGYEAAPQWLQRGLDFFGMSPAFAHAKNVCWNGSKPKVSEETGGGRHITNHRYDRNGFRRTRTDHQHVEYWGWRTDATYYYKINKRYC